MKFYKLQDFPKIKITALLKRFSNRDENLLSVMDKKIIFFIGCALLLSGCDGTEKVKSSERKQMPSLTLSCVIQYGGYNVIDERQRYRPKENYTKNVLIYVHNDWHKSNNEEYGWRIGYDDGNNFYPNAGDDPRQEGHPWWFSKVSVSEFEIFAESTTGYRQSSRLGSRTTLKIKRSTGLLESEFKVWYGESYEREYSVHTQKGKCQKAEQQF